jgi:MFS family permease
MQYAASDQGLLVAVQGLGAGAITALTQIIIADLVPLTERGVFNGIMALCVHSRLAQI